MQTRETWGLSSGVFRHRNQGFPCRMCRRRVRFTTPRARALVVFHASTTRLLYPPADLLNLQNRNEPAHVSLLSRELNETVVDLPLLKALQRRALAPAVRLEGITPNWPAHPGERPLPHPQLSHAMDRSTSPEPPPHWLCLGISLLISAAASLSSRQPDL
ncbi:hypothetical protein LX36DRAFT_56952 [Colletotrichum falcatum]|nr:hypothetical protein LX36DRAFT_56952 [Colletotrichum falcatum]